MRRFLVFQARYDSGLGDHLISLLNHARYAELSGRRLALDMTEFQYFATERHRNFFACFDVVCPNRQSVLTDLEAVRRLYDSPSQVTLTHYSPLRDDTAFAEDVVIVPGTYRNSLLPPWSPQGRDYRIRLAGEIKAHVDGLLDPMFDADVLGVHFRHGNGELLGDRFDAVKFDDPATKFEEICGEYRRRIQQQRQRFGEACRVFVASDHAPFKAWIRSQFPTAFSVARHAPDTHWMHHLKDSGHDPRVLWDAAADLWGLSRCRAICCGVSAFTEFAVMNSDRVTQGDLTIIDLFSISALIGRGRTDDAIAAARRAIEIAGWDANLRKQLIGLLLQRSEFAEAAALARKGLEINGDDAELARVLANLPGRDGPAATR